MERLPAGTTSERLNIRLWRVDEAEALSTAINESLAHLQPWMDGWTAHPATTGDGIYEWAVASTPASPARADVHRAAPPASGMVRTFGGGTFVVQPDRKHPFVVPDLQPWRCSLDWTPGRVTFQVTGGEPWTVSGAAVPPPGSAHPRINLWLFGGLPPSGNDPIEVRLTDFRFTPR